MHESLLDLSLRTRALGFRRHVRGEDRLADITGLLHAAADEHRDDLGLLCNHGRNLVRYTLCFGEFGTWRKLKIDDTPRLILSRDEPCGQFPNSKQSRAEHQERCQYGQ